MPLQGFCLDRRERLTGFHHARLYGLNSPGTNTPSDIVEKCECEMALVQGKDEWAPFRGV